MKIFIDTEFNGFGGELISMALVDEKGREFYEVLMPFQVIDPWVKENVIPVLEKSPVTATEFKDKLYEYLSAYADSSFELVADWPDDIRYFLQSIILSPGKMMAIPSFSMLFMRELSSSKSKIPHNALHDARAIMEHYCRLENFSNPTHNGG